MSTLGDRRFFGVAAVPALMIVAAVTAVPIALALALSFTGYSGDNPGFTWVGLDNYRSVLSDPQVPGVLKTTVVFTSVALVVEVAAGTALALLLRRSSRGIKVFRVIYMLPLMVAPVASAFAWRALFFTDGGWVNYVFGEVGLPAQNWLGSSGLAMVSVIVADAWIGIPVVAVLVLAGLMGLPSDPVEQAQVDGASARQTLWHITLPAIRPILMFAIIFRTVGLFQQFATFQVMTGGGPGNSTTVLNFFIYQNTFIYGNLGYGATLAVILVLMMAIPVTIALFLARVRR